VLTSVAGRQRFTRGDRFDLLEKGIFLFSIFLLFYFSILCIVPDQTADAVRSSVLYQISMAKMPLGHLNWSSISWITRILDA